MANSVDIPLVIIQSVFVWAVVAGLLQITQTTCDWVSPATAIRLTGPFAQSTFVQRVPTRCTLSPCTLLVFQRRIVFVGLVFLLFNFDSGIRRSIAIPQSISAVRN